MPTIDRTSATTAKPPTSSDSDRGRSSDCATSSSIVARSVKRQRSGRARERPAARRAAPSADSTLGPQHDDSGRVHPAIGVYTVPSSGLSRPAYFTSLTTPTTVVHGQFVQPPSRNRLPTALPLGKNRRAHARSTTTLSRFSRSASRSSRRRPSSKRQAEHAEVLRRHGDPRRDRLRLSRRRREVLQIEVVEVADVVRRPAVGERHAGHAGQRLDASLELVPERRRPARAP